MNTTALLEKHFPENSQKPGLDIGWTYILVPLGHTTNFMIQAEHMGQTRQEVKRPKKLFSFFFLVTVYSPDMILYILRLKMFSIK